MVLILAPYRLPLSPTMGAVPSVPTDRITAIATDTMGAFTPAYVKAYTRALIEQLKAEAEAKPTPWQLREWVPPATPLKEGLLTKQGAVRKSWKVRYFVARNAADNFTIDYYDSEAAFKAAPEKPRGCVSVTVQVSRLAARVCAWPPPARTPHPALGCACWRCNWRGALFVASCGALWRGERIVA
jgi:hypothetical protein